LARRIWSILKLKPALDVLDLTVPYVKQTKNPEGTVSHNLGFISADKLRADERPGQAERGALGAETCITVLAHPDTRLAMAPITSAYMKAVLAVLILAAIAAPSVTLAGNKPSSFVPHQRSGPHVYGSPVQPAGHASKSTRHVRAPKKAAAREPLVPKGIAN
jgi:hypothetical protein